jgi:hypothetical protein
LGTLGTLGTLGIFGKRGIVGFGIEAAIVDCIELKRDGISYIILSQYNL